MRAGLFFLLLCSPLVAEQPRLKVLFLGDRGHHQPQLRAADLLAPLARQGIDLAYTDDTEILRSSSLKDHDCLLIYANHTKITPEQEKGLLDYVEGGKGLVVLHCGAYCFLNSPKYLSLVGGQFQRHGAIHEFKTKITDAKHDALRGVEEFSAFDEPYEHHRLGDDIKVLMVREDRGGKKEPWTWVRTQGKGRVFYTASGHDERVFQHSGYHKLVTSGIRWACGKPDHTFDLPEFKRVEADLPKYGQGPRGKITDMQAPLSPADSMKCISTPGGFKVELFASEPDIVKPIAITWDDHGRTYIAETLDYPNELQPEGKGRDRIRLCEDTDGDGKADKFTVFADKLSIPTSLVYAPGHGLIVCQAPHILLLRDKDGDGKADETKVLFSGFNTNDTHAGPSNLRLGFDGWIYATCGYSGFSGNVGGKRHQFKQGVFRFKPDGSDLEFLGSSSNNTWGLGFDEAGEIFYSTANGEHSSFLAIPNRYFEQVRGYLGKGTARMADQTKMHPLTAIRQVDYHGGFTAAAGHALYTARQFPNTYWNKVAFVTEPTGHLVAMLSLERDGAGYITKDRFNLFASLDEWTAPIAAEVGPDGAVWILDWYNVIVQHNPTPPGFKTGKGNAYETLLRDKKHGRIYRVVGTTSSVDKSVDLTKRTDKQLFEVLKSPNLFWRMQAQWNLIQRGKDATFSVKDIEEALKDADSLTTLHGLWTLHHLGVLKYDGEKSLLHQALASKEATVCRTALKLLPRSADAASAILKHNLLNNPDLLLRRDALLALSEMPPSTDIGKAIARSLATGSDDLWIGRAATCAAARHDVGFLQAALVEKSNPAIVRIVAEHLARGEAADLNGLMVALKNADATTVQPFLSGMVAGWPTSRAITLSKEAREALTTLLPRLNAEGKLAMLTLGKRWGLEKELMASTETLRKTLREKILATKGDEKERIEAARQTAQLGLDDTTMAALLDSLGVQATPTLASGFLDALGQSTAVEVAPALLARWTKLTPAMRSQAVDVLLRRPGWSLALLDAIDKGTLTVGDLSATQAQQLSGHPDKSLAEKAKSLLAKGGRLANPDRQKVIDQFLAVTTKTGDVARGKEIFKKTCAKCHRHGDLGERIGPELTGFGVHPKEKLLIEILDPNRSVEGNFRQYNVVTASGRVFNGLLASETKTAIELVDPEAKRHTILRQDIEEMSATGKSIMPEGIEKELKEAEFVDLLEFLTQKGKYFALPLDKAATITSLKGMFFSEDSPIERLIFPDWTPKTFDGIPFVLVDPKGGSAKNVVLLHGPNGTTAPKMPKSVTLPCNAPIKTLHLLSGISGWGHPFGQRGSVSMIVRLHYADGKTEDHELKNGVHFADYIRREDVPESKFAYALRGQQVRYLSVTPKRQQVVREVEFLKGRDASAPIVMAVTVEQP